MEKAKEFISRYKWHLAIGGVIAALILVASMVCAGGEEPVPPPEPTPTPEPTPMPTPTPVLLATAIPSIHVQFTQYRLSHFAYEYGVCFEAEFTNEAVAGSVARFHTAAAEAEILSDIPAAVARLLDAYDTGVCEERSDFSAHPGRGTWLRHWSTIIR